MDNPDLHHQQRAMTRYLRDPDNCPAPAGMDVVRVQIYRDLVFDNLRSLLSGTFPVLVSVLGETGWRDLVRVFLRDYRAVTPKFGEIAKEFVVFLASGQPSLEREPWPAFMSELAHYEWVEMALQQADAEPLPVNEQGVLLDQPLQRSPVAWPLAYHWPVHQLGADYRPVAPASQPTLLLIRRTRDWRVRFSELSPLAWRLLQRIEQFPQLSAREQLQGLAEEACASESKVFMASALDLLRHMQAEGVIGVAQVVPASPSAGSAQRSG